MPVFHFSEQSCFDADDGIEFPTLDDACREAEEGLRNIAACQPPGSPSVSMTIWNEYGEVVCILRLTVEAVRPGRSLD